MSPSRTGPHIVIYKTAIIMKESTNELIKSFDELREKLLSVLLDDLKEVLVSTPAHRVRFDLSLRDADFELVGSQVYERHMDACFPASIAEVYLNGKGNAVAVKESEEGDLCDTDDARNLTIGQIEDLLVLVETLENACSKGDVVKRDETSRDIIRYEYYEGGRTPVYGEPYHVTVYALPDED